MGKEILAIPEQHLAGIVKVIRVGLKRMDWEFLNATSGHITTVQHVEEISDEGIERLQDWCNEMEEYLNGSTDTN